MPEHAAPEVRPSWGARARKFLVACAGLVATVIASGALDEPQYDTVRTWTTLVIAVLTAAGIYRVPNAQEPPA
jgi:hypothetical protein